VFPSGTAARAGLWAVPSRYRVRCPVSWCAATRSGLAASAGGDGLHPPQQIHTHSWAQPVFFCCFLMPLTSPCLSLGSTWSSCWGCWMDEQKGREPVHGQSLPRAATSEPWAQPCCRPHPASCSVQRRPRFVTCLSPTPPWLGPLLARLQGFGTGESGAQKHREEKAKANRQAFKGEMRLFCFGGRKEKKSHRKRAFSQALGGRPADAGASASFPGRCRAPAPASCRGCPRAGGERRGAAGAVVPAAFLPCPPTAPGASPWVCMRVLWGTGRSLG